MAMLTLFKIQLITQAPIALQVVIFYQLQMVIIELDLTLHPMLKLFINDTVTKKMQLLVLKKI